MRCGAAPALQAPAMRRDAGAGARRYQISSATQHALWCFAAPKHRPHVLRLGGAGLFRVFQMQGRAASSRVMPTAAGSVCLYWQCSLRISRRRGYSSSVEVAARACCSLQHPAGDQRWLMAQLTAAVMGPAVSGRQGDRCALLPCGTTTHGAAVSSSTLQLCSSPCGFS